MFKYLNLTFCALLFLLGVNFSAHAQTNFKGEIINIDKQNHIAFSNLTQAQLSLGDIVEIHNGNNFVAYLEVTEIKDTMSKLGPVNRKGLTTRLEDFAGIAIGHQVVKTVKGSHLEDTDALLTQISQTILSNQSLEEQLRREKVLNKTIELENQTYKKKVDELNQTISSLQENLINVSRILDEKIKNYK